MHPETNKWSDELGHTFQGDKMTLCYVKDFSCSIKYRAACVTIEKTSTSHTSCTFTGHTSQITTKLQN